MWPFGVAPGGAPRVGIGRRRRMSRIKKPNEALRKADPKFKNERGKASLVRPDVPSILDCEIFLAFAGESGIESDMLWSRSRMIMLRIG